MGVDASSQREQESGEPCLDTGCWRWGRSSRGPVFVNQAAEDACTRCRGIDATGGGEFRLGHRGSLVDGAVWAVLVVVGRVLSKDGSEVSFTDGE